MKTRIAASLPLYLLAAMLVTSSDGCAELGLSSLSADPIDSQVVDADTGAPVEGAIIVAHWELHQGSFTGDGLPCGAANVEEAITDKDGRFHIAGWGPTRNSCGFMQGDEPMLWVFKWGYHHAGFSNGNPSVQTVTVTHSAWKDRQMKLRRAANVGDLSSYKVDSYASEFDTLNGRLELFLLDLPGECNWKRTPMTLRELLDEQRQINAAGLNIKSITSKLIENDSEYTRAAPQCGSPKSFIQGLSK
jgi:hypothetical protein